MDYKDYLKLSGDKIEAKEVEGVNNPKTFLDKLKSIKDGNYGQMMVSKSKYTIRGALIGGLIGVSGSFYYKKPILFGAVIGIVGGTMLGHVIGEMFFQKNIKCVKK